MGSWEEFQYDPGEYKGVYTKPSEEDRNPTGFFGTLLDIVSRPNYAVAGFTDELVKGNPFRAFKALATEFVAPEKRFTFSDVIKENAPRFYHGNPVTAHILGFAMDVALDPLTYVSFGAGGVGRKIMVDGAKRTLTTTGLKKFTSLRNQLLSKQGATGLSAKLAEGTLADGEGLVGVVDRAEKIMSRLIKHQPDLALGKRAVSVNLSVPFGEKGVVVGFSNPWIDPIFDGLKKKVEAIDEKMLGSRYSRIYERSKQGATRVGEMADKVIGGFQKNWKLPKAFVAIKDSMLSGLRYSEQRVHHMMVDIFNTFDLDQRRKIGEFALETDEVLRQVWQEEAVGRGLMEPVWNKEGNKIIGAEARKDVTSIPSLRGMEPDEAKAQFKSWMDLMNQNFQDFNVPRVLNDLKKKHNLTDQEFGAYMQMRRHFTDLAARESEAGLLESVVAGYSPRLYQTVADADYIGMVKLLKQRGMRASLRFAKQRQIKTLAQARAMGLEVETDVAAMFASRAVAGERALAMRAFQNAGSDILQGLEDSPRIWNLVRKDMDWVGQGVYDPHMTEAGGIWLKGYDKLLRAFKMGATFAKPGFASRQLFSNTMQKYLGSGIKATGVFDPRLQKVIGHVLHYYDNPIKLRELSKKFRLMTNAGEEINFERFALELAQYDIAQGMAMGVANMERGVKSVLKQIDVMAEGGESYWHVAKSTMQYWNWASRIEDWSRAGLYLQARMIGHSPVSAQKLVNKALFDYAHGLSAFEQKLMKRVVPFYSFQRFAIPFIAKTAITDPGRLVNAKKTAVAAFDSLNKLMGGQELTDTERRVIPGWLLEQPATYVRTGQDMQAVFATFNSFTPLDVLAFGEVSKNGELDWRRTAEKALLSQIAPLMKAPIELFANKNFFTGRNIVPKTHEQQEIAKLIGMREIPEGLAKLVTMGPDALSAIGFEITEDDMGKKRAFMNPYIAYASGVFFPALNTLFKIQPDMNPLENTLYMFSGITRIKMDMAKQVEYRKKEMASIMRQAKTYTADLEKKGLMHPAKARQILTELFNETAEQYDALSGPVRGTQTVGGRDVPFQGVVPGPKIPKP